MRILARWGFYPEAAGRATSGFHPRQEDVPGIRWSLRTITGTSRRAIRA
jgi:hypothetical protein